MNRFTISVQIAACAITLASCATPPEKGQAGGSTGGGGSVSGAGIELLEFYADWNRACKMQEEVTKALAEEYAGRVKVTRVDTEANPDALRGYGVDAKPPVLILLVDGKAVATLNGLRSAETLKQLIDKAFEKK